MRSMGVWFLAILLLVVFAAAGTGGEKNSWDLAGVEKIDLDGVSGDVVIVAADGGGARVELESDVRPDRNFEPAVDLRGNRLRIKERWHGSSRGSVRWTIYLPKSDDGPLVEVSNASGNLVCDDVALAVSFKTASGNVDLSKVDLLASSKFKTASGDYNIRDMTVSDDSSFRTASGDLELTGLTIGDESEFTTASGDIRITNCASGDDVSFSSASGDVEVRDIDIKGESKFSSASGNVDVRLDRLPDSGFRASSASGDVTLSVDDFGDDFTLVLIKREDKGRISCPFDFTDEEEFEQHRQTYVRKIVERGSGEPVITLRTASGRVTVKK